MTSITTKSQTRTKRKAPTTLPSEIITELIGPYMHHDCKEITANASRCARAFRYNYQTSNANCSQYCVENARMWLPQLLTTLFPTNANPNIFPELEVHFALALTPEYDEKSFEESFGYALVNKDQTYILPITEIYLYFYKRNGAYEKHSIYPISRSPGLIYSELAKQLGLAASDSDNALVALEIEINAYLLTNDTSTDWLDNAIDVSAITRYNPAAAEITVSAIPETVFGLNKNWHVYVQSPDLNLPPWVQHRAIFSSLIPVY